MMYYIFEVRLGAFRVLTYSTVFGAGFPHFFVGLILPAGHTAVCMHGPRGETGRDRRIDIFMRLQQTEEQLYGVGG